MSFLCILMPMKVQCLADPEQCPQGNYPPIACQGALSSPPSQLTIPPTSGKMTRTPDMGKSFQRASKYHQILLKPGQPRPSVPATCSKQGDSRILTDKSSGGKREEPKASPWSPTQLMKMTQAKFGMPASPHLILMRASHTNERSVNAWELWWLNGASIVLKT